MTQKEMSDDGYSRKSKDRGLATLFQCPNCKAKIDAYLLWNEKEKQYSASFCPRCSGVFELQMGLDPRFVPPIREPTR